MESRLNPLEKRLRALPPAVLKSLRRGIEKESLRVRADGMLAATPHPMALGSPLTHPRITTDFCEAQLELITGVHPDAEACLKELTEIHQLVYRAIGDEMLWCASMPCGLPADDAIPIGRYGTSNIGRAKSVYRIGLGHRYGRRMQTISGIHYNFSLPEEAWRALDWHGGPNDAYFALIRNFRRHSWLLLYLFGASPAVCSSFVAGRTHDLQELKPGTLYRPGATSLRMGPLGYQSDAQASLAVSYNSLETYGASLEDALTRPYPRYEAIGIRTGEDSADVLDQYCQLATSLLQIENEFYGTIRPKRVIRPGERPLHALRERGVEYVEVRCMDIDPFASVGIKATTMRFLDLFLLHCLLTESPPDTPEEIAALARNQYRAAARGRESGMRLERRGEEVALTDWGSEVLGECAPVAAALDDATGSTAYRDALTAAVGAVNDPSLLPSARVLRRMARDHGNSYIKFVLAQSLKHQHTVQRLALEPDVQQRFARMAAESLAKQRQIEAADTIGFEEWRRYYLAPERLEA